MQVVYALRFYNDGDEWEDYGVYATRASAVQKIVEMQQEYGADVFEDERWEITEQTVQRKQTQRKQKMK